MTTYIRLKEILTGDYNLPEEKLAPEARLEELGIDSLGVMELLFKIEDAFQIDVPSEQVPLATVADVVDYIERLVAEQSLSSSASSS